MSPSGSWVVAISDQIYAASTAPGQRGFKSYSSSVPLTCIAFHPTEEYFATGDQTGRIRLWFCLENETATPSSKTRRAQTTAMHWHAHAVLGLAFSPNGVYLLSGGEESVLVIWHLDSGKKDFVPRVGSPIVSVTTVGGTDRGLEYLLGLEDGTLLFINANTQKATKSISRLKLS